MAKGYFDDAQKYNYSYDIGTNWNYVWTAGAGGPHPAAVDLTSLLTTGIQHSLKLYVYCGAGYAGGFYYNVVKHEQAVVVWTT